MNVINLPERRETRPAEPVESAPWELWPSMMVNGNALYEEGRFEQARLVYQDCVALTQCYFESWPNSKGALSAALVSGMNLVAASVALDEIEEASEQICAVHCFILAVVRDPALSLALRISAHKFLGRSVFELKRFQSNHGGGAPVAYWISNSCVCKEWRQVQAELKQQASSAGAQRVH